MEHKHFLWTATYGLILHRASKDLFATAGGCCTVATQQLSGKDSPFTSFMFFNKKKIRF